MADFNKKVTLIEVDIDNDAAIADVEKLTNALLAEQSALKKNNDEIKALEKSQKQINKEQEQGLITSKEASKLRKQNVDQIERLKKSNLNLKDGIKDINRERTQSVKVSKLQANSLDALRNKTIAQKKELNGLNTATVEGAKRFDQLTEELEKNNNAIVAADQSAGDFKTTVGRYKDELTGAISGTGEFGSTISGVFDLLKTNPIILIVSALAGLFAAFTKTSKGAKFLAQASAFLGGIMAELIGFVDQFASFLTSAFEDPQQAIKDLGNFLIDNIVNRFKAIIDLGGALGKIIKSLFERDFEGLKNAAKDAGTALIQFNTGLDAEQQKKFADGLSNITKEALETANAFAELAGRQIDVANANRFSALEAAKLGKQEEELLAIRDDATKSFREREEANFAALELSQQRADQELKIARRNQALINEEIALREANGEAVQDLLDQQLDANLAVIESEKELSLTIAENERERNTLKQDRLEKDLDILIDGFDNFKTITEKAIADTDKPLEERINLLGRLTKESENAFDEQVNTIQQFSDKQIDIIDLINETDTKALNDKIRNLELSEIIEGRLLEVIRERRIVLSDLGEAEKELNAEKVEREELEIERQEEAAEAERDRLFANLEKLQEIRDQKTAEELEKLEKKEQTKKDILAAALDAAQGAIGLAFDIASDRRSREFEDESTQLELKHQDEQAQLRQSLENGTITQEEFDKKNLELEKKLALDQHAIAVAEFNANKKASLGEIAIQTAIAIAKALASSPPPANFIAAGVVGGAAALQAIAVGTQRPPAAPQFAEGGDVFGSIAGGKLHSEGGTKYKGSDGNEFEVEKGEGIFVTKREATNPALSILSGVNERFGGASMFGNSSRFLQQGGQAGGLGASEISKLASEIVQGLPTPVVEVQSVMAGINADIDAKSVGIK